MSTLNLKTTGRIPPLADLNRRAFLASCFSLAGGIATGGPKPETKTFSVSRIAPLGPREVLAMGCCLGDRIAEGDILWVERGARAECHEIRTGEGRVAELLTGKRGILHLRGGAVGQLVNGTVLIGNGDWFERTVLREAQVKQFPDRCALLAGNYQLILHTSLIPTQVLWPRCATSTSSSFGVKFVLPSMISNDLRGPVAFVAKDQIIASGNLTR